MTIKEHIRFGLHSKIPKCCIRFFISKEWQSKTIQEMLDYEGPLDGAGYTRCPECMKENRRVKIHNCDWASLLCQKYLPQKEVKKVLELQRIKEYYKDKKLV